MDNDIKIENEREFRHSNTPINIEKASNAEEGDSIGTFGGVIKFNDLSADLGGFREQIAPEAFDDSLLCNDIRSYYMHDPHKPLGSLSSGTLKITKSPEGLHVKGEIPDTTYGRDFKAANNTKKSELKGLSFGMNVIKDTWKKVEGALIRTITKANLFEVSPVGSPAYLNNKIIMTRSIQDALRENTAKPEYEINGTCLKFAKELIASGDIDVGVWAFTAEQENKILGEKEDWGNYSKCFLVIDKNAEDNTKARFHYPIISLVGRKFEISKHAVSAVLSRSEQQDLTALTTTAHELDEAIADKLSKKTNNREKAIIELEKRFLESKNIIN